MKTGTSCAIAVASLCLFCTALGADPAAQPAVTVDVKQLPAPVQKTLALECDHVGQVQQQTGNGSTVYQATVSKGGKNYSLDIAKDGTVLKREPVSDRP